MSGVSAGQVYGKGNTPRIVAFDCGMKFNIVRYFVHHQKAQITVVPWNYDLKVSSTLPHSCLLEQPYRTLLASSYGMAWQL